MSGKRRRRKRPRGQAGASPQPRANPAPKQGPRRALPAEQRPPAPWGSFPLSELVILIGIVILVAGFVTSGERGTVMIATGMALCSLAALDFAIREHFAGYRSHTLLLAAVPAVIVLGVLFYFGPTELPQLARLAIGLAVFGVCAWLLAAAFRRRSGLSFKLR